MNRSKEDEAHCRKCKWGREQPHGNGTCCGYSVEDGNHSRVAMHYQRIGRESLEGFTHGVGCTEFEPRVKAKRKVTRHKPDGKFRQLNLDAYMRLKDLHPWREIAEVMGCSTANARLRQFDGTITADSAAKIKKAYGVDVIATNVNATRSQTHS